MSTIYVIVLGLAATSTLTVGVARQIRLHLRDQADRVLAREVFALTQSTDGLAGYMRLVNARRGGLPMGTTAAAPIEAEPPSTE